jgi:putative tryptophan/tyrosine transport system substrate-binding protein
VRARLLFSAHSRASGNPSLGPRFHGDERKFARREFIALVASSAAAAWPLAARAQQLKMPVIGFLNTSAAEALASRLATFREGLGQFGYVEGQNVAIEYRWAEGSYDRLPAMAADLVQRQVAVIAASATAAALAAEAATSTTPIIFAIGGDPVRFHLVSSLARPGGNATGINFFTNAVGQKRLGLLHELVPKVAVIGVLANSSNPNTARDIEELQAAADLLAYKLVVARASTVPEIDAAFTMLVQASIGGLVVNADGFFTSRRVQITTLAARHGIPAIYAGSNFVAVGGLMSYASNGDDAYRSMGIYTARILKGTKPSDLPVLEPTKLELVINLSTARALSLAIPPGIIAIADEVIE